MPSPPRLFLRFFRWYCHPKIRYYIEGDLLEVYQTRCRTIGKRRADLRFIVDVLLLFRPGIIRPSEGYRQLNNYGMLKNYLKIGWRNLINDKVYSFINISGLAIGAAVSMLIGLWVIDEMSYDKQQKNYETMAVVLQNNTIDGQIETWSTQSYQLGEELRTSYGGHFKHVVMSTFPRRCVLADKDEKFMIRGAFMERDAPSVLALAMLSGSPFALSDPSSILVSQSTAQKFFGNESPIDKVLKMDDYVDLKVAGVYRDIPENSSFKGELDFIAPLEIIVRQGGRNLGWVNSWLNVYVQVADNVDMATASLAIKDIKMKYIEKDQAGFKPELFLHPMPRWHLYSGFENGVNSGGAIEYVVLFGAIGICVMMLACINFMNLSTARSQKRAKEVGVRKVIGSRRRQLVSQFVTESLLIVFLSFFLAVLFVQLLLPLFNGIAQKNIVLPWTSISFWSMFFGFAFLIALISSIYPAFYLSAFQPIKVLKGTFKLGRYSSIPRKTLVLVQFTLSVVLIIGTAIVYRQVQHAKNRPIGYDLNGLITIPIRTPEVKKTYEAMRNELMTSSLISEVSTSESNVNYMGYSDSGFSWPGKDPNMQDVMFRGQVSAEFGKTVGWKIKEGRDFSRDIASDSNAIILNESAVKYMGLKNPVGETIRTYYAAFTVIGVVEDMLTLSAYQPFKQTYFILDRFDRAAMINVKINPEASASEALAALNDTFMKHNPNTPFEYDFANVDFAEKFEFEERLGTLVGVFTVLAIVISCLGLFGLASFMAEQRTKEIGVRKVLGASVFGLWRMLSKDFAGLTILSIFIASPIAYYFMQNWLESYDYRTKISWWIFGASGLGALLLAMITVSYQCIKASTANPVNSLRSE